MSGDTGGINTTLVATSFNDGRNVETERQAQQLLEINGFPPFGGADGWYGPCTEAAVREFQLANGLPPTGELTIGDDTWNLLVAGANGDPSVNVGNGVEISASGLSEADRPVPSSGLEEGQESGNDAEVDASPEMQAVTEAATNVAELQALLATQAVDPTLQAELERSHANARMTLDAAVQALVEARAAAAGANPANYEAYQNQLADVEAELAAEFAGDPVLLDSLERVTARLQTVEYLTERRDALQSGLDDYVAGDTQLPGERAWIAEREAEIARHDALIAGAEAADAAASGALANAADATDVALQTVVDDDYATTNPNAADAHDTVANERTDAAVLEEFEALVDSGLTPREARAEMQSRHPEGSEQRSVLDASLARLDRAGSLTA